jgi:hypothetical protein
MEDAYGRLFISCRKGSISTIEEERVSGTVGILGRVDPNPDLER